MKLNIVNNSILLLMQLIFVSTAFSQNWQWIEEVESNSSQIRIKDFEIVDNYIYAISRVNDYLIIEGDTVEKDVDLYGTVLLKYNKESGRVVFYKIYQSIEFDYIESDHLGDIILAGEYSRTGYFDTIQIDDPGYSRNLIVSKINYSGNGIWAMTATGDGNIFSLTTDNQGNPSISGSLYYELTIDSIQISTGNYSDDIYVARINSNGHIDWVLTGGGPGNDIYMGSSALTTDKDQNIFLAASTMGNAVFGDTALNPLNTLNEEIILIKLDKYGNIIWHQTMGGFDTDYPRDIFLSSHEYLYITGAVGSDPTFGDTTIDVHYDNEEDIFVSCWDTSGNHIQTNVFGNSTWDEYGLLLDETPDGNILLGGIFRGSITSQEGTIYSSGSASGSMFIAELDTICNLLNAITIGGATYLDELEISNLGYVYFSGTINGTVTIDDSTYTEHYLAKYTFQNLLITGNIYIDKNGNCQLDSLDNPVSKRYVVNFMPSGELVNTDSNGYFRVHVYPGSYTISFPQNYGYEEGSCANSEFVTLNDIDTVQNVSLFLTEDFNFIGLVSNKKLISIYPNPTKDFTRIDYQLPEGTTTGTITLYDLGGREIKTYNVDNESDHLEISTQHLRPGTYFYNLTTANGVSQGKKMIKI